MKTVYNIQNNHDNTSNPSQYYRPDFNPMDKLMDVIEKKDLLVAENRKLYEALLEAERDKNALLINLLNDKNKQEYISSQ
jgi:hypothetical protein